MCWVKNKRFFVLWTVNPIPMWFASEPLHKFAVLRHRHYRWILQRFKYRWYVCGLTRAHTPFGLNYPDRQMANWKRPCKIIFFLRDQRTTRRFTCRVLNGLSSEYLADRRNDFAHKTGIRRWKRRQFMRIAGVRVFARRLRRPSNGPGIKIHVTG